MKKNPLRTLAEIAAIIACIIALLTYFNIQPSCTSHKDVNNTEVNIPATEQIIEDSIGSEYILNPISDNETDLSIKTSDEFSLWGGNHPRYWPIKRLDWNFWLFDSSCAKHYSWLVYACVFGSLVVLQIITYLENLFTSKLYWNIFYRLFLDVHLASLDVPLSL